MAITFQSAQHAKTNSGTTLTITKPVSVAVGDLLVCVISAANSVDTLSGWTLITSQSNTDGNLFTFYKIAVSGDVSASDYTWTFSGNAVVGGILRFTGEFHSTPISFAKDNENTATATPTYTATITPVTANSMLLFCVSFVYASGAGSSGTVSGYAVTTSNPSWTEAFDQSQTTGGSGDTQCSVAYATRPEITATGDASCTCTLSRRSSCIILAIRPKIVFTQTDTLVLVDSLKKVIRRTISSTVSLVDTLITNKSRKWTKKTKPTTIWTKKIK